ncbi:MAG TPA: PQQ-dependent sugar dehydrogenase, partial [Pyrinomonadaceae bacterium]|nr:PQQ-dependent sugar dehydrogenase [Pyrinomonadaceae bacterium]
MKRTVLASSVLLVVVLALAAGGVYGSRVSARQTSQLPVVALVAPITGLSLPIGITHAGDGTGRLFIIEQAGRIRVFKNGALLAAPFLDISARVSCCGERGLLGLAFPADYASKNYFYVNYTNTSGHTVVARYRRSAADPDAADPASEQI